MRAHSHSHNENVPAGIELTTLTLTLSPLTTRVYDPAFLCDTTRAFARWECQAPVARVKVPIARILLEFLPIPSELTSTFILHPILSV